MELEVLDAELSVCKLNTKTEPDLPGGLYFLARTDEELSLVCETERVPAAALARDDGWRAFRIRGTLDFSLIGILSRLSAVLAEQGIGIFAVSTYNTDYILVKRENLHRALAALEQAGYVIA